MKHTVKAKVLTIRTDHAFLELFKSEAIFILQKRGMTIACGAGNYYPPLAQATQEKRTTTGATYYA